MKLPSREQLKIWFHNAMTPFCAIAFILVFLLDFTRRINMRRGKHSQKGLLIPHCIPVEVGGEVPAKLSLQWRKYGIPSVGFSSFVRKDKDSGLYEHMVYYFVSPNQKWVATRIAASLGWAVLRDVTDHERGSAIADAAKGIWKPSGAEPAVGSLFEGGVGALAKLLGVTGAYTKDLMQEPGIRTPRPGRPATHAAHSEPIRPQRPGRPAWARRTSR